MKTSEKYVDLWTNSKSSIENKLKIVSTNKASIQLRPNDFDNVGDRRSYSFNLEFINGIVSNNIDGSAVARDLAKVLENSPVIRNIMKSGHYKLRLDKNFCLWIEKL